MNVQSSHYFFTGMLLSVAVLVVLIFLPFITPIVIALALSVVFGRLHKFILDKFFKSKERSTFGALVTTIIITIVVLIPSIFIIGKLYNEIQDTYFYLTEESNQSNVVKFLNEASAWISSTFFDIYPTYSFETINITEYIQRGLEWAFSHIDTLFSSVTKISMGVFITFLSLFYFFRDGRELKRQVIALSPLGDTNDERILKKLEQAIYSIVGGSLVVGLIQGILTGIGFFIFGVPNPAAWGSVAAVSALIPGVGTSLVLVPGIIYLFISGSVGHAIGLLIWGLLAVGLIDNILGPMLMNKGIDIHPLLILLSVIGGIIFFGAIGFILGPLVFALFFALLDIYRTSKL